MFSIGFVDSDRNHFPGRRDIENCRTVDSEDHIVLDTLLQPIRLHCRIWTGPVHQSRL